MYTPEFDYHKAGSVAEAIELLGSHPDARLLAGGHSLIPLMRLRLARPATIIDIGGVAELKGISINGDTIRIGALTTHGEIASSHAMRNANPMMAEAANGIGDPQVRNRGTIAGNIAHADPASDWGTVLTALEASIEVQGPNGSRTVAVEDFFQGPFTTALADNEVITAIQVPALSSHVHNGGHGHDHGHDHPHEEPAAAAHDHGHDHPHEEPAAAAHDHGHDHPHEEPAAAAHDHGHGHPHEEPAAAAHDHGHDHPHEEPAAAAQDHGHDHPHEEPAAAAHDHGHDHPHEEPAAAAHDHGHDHPHEEPAAAAHDHGHDHPHEEPAAAAHDHGHGHPHEEPAAAAHDHSHDHPHEEPAAAAHDHGHDHSHEEPAAAQDHGHEHGPSLADIHGEVGEYAKMAHPASFYPVVGGAVIVTVENSRCTAARIAVGGLVPKPMRARSVEAALTGKELTEANISEAVSHLADDLGDDIIGDIFASAEYRRVMAPVEVKHALYHAIGLAHH